MCHKFGSVQELTSFTVRQVAQWGESVTYEASLACHGTVRWRSILPYKKWHSAYEVTCFFYIFILKLRYLFYFIYFFNDLGPHKHLGSVSEMQSVHINTADDAFTWPSTGRLRAGVNRRRIVWRYSVVSKSQLCKLKTQHILWRKKDNGEKYAQGFVCLDQRQDGAVTQKECEPT